MPVRRPRRRPHDTPRGSNNAAFRDPRRPADVSALFVTEISARVVGCGDTTRLFSFSVPEKDAFFFAATLFVD